MRHSAEDEDCSFCQEISGHFCVDDLIGGEVGGRVVDATPHWWVAPTVGPLALGHVLVCSREHLRAALDGEAVAMTELDALLESSIAKLEQTFGGPVVAFEHGTGSSPQRKTGACIDHAHIHLCPGPLAFFDAVRSALSPWKECSSLAELATVRGDLPYLMVGRPGQGFYIHETSEVVPSQWLRMHLARQLGVLQEWDWRRYPRQSVFMETLARLRG